MLKAIEKEDLENVDTLLEHYRHDLGAVQGEALSTALGNNERDSSLEILRLLFNRGADINARDARGDTPSLRAVAFDKVEALKLLLNTEGIGVNI